MAGEINFSRRFLPKYIFHGRRALNQFHPKTSRMNPLGLVIRFFASDLKLHDNLGLRPRLHRAIFDPRLETISITPTLWVQPIRNIATQIVFEWVSWLQTQPDKMHSLGPYKTHTPNTPYPSFSATLLGIARPMITDVKGRQGITC